MKPTVLTFLLALFLSPGAASAGDWPGWRGPRGDGISDEKDVPIKWGKDENIAWKTLIPGNGHSSPIIFGDRVFVTTCIEDKDERRLLCLDRRDGKIVWDRLVLTAKLEKVHRLNSRASSTPATDGKLVFVTFLDETQILVAAYDFEGKEVWRKSPGKFASVHGFCSSPILYKDTVIVNGDHDGSGYLVSLAKSDGEQRWKVDRPNHTRSYCAPLIIETGGRTQMVLSGSKCVSSYDPDSGKLFWTIKGPTEQFVSSLVYLDGILFLTTGFPEFHYLGIKPDGEGDVTKTHVLWHHARVPEREGAYVPSPIAYGQWFFAASDHGLLNCFEAKTGEWKWKEQMGKHQSGSPVFANGNLYFTADSGDTWVVKANGEKFEVVSKNPLGEECHSSPAVAQGQLFIRGDQNLYCIGKK